VCSSDLIEGHRAPGKVTFDRFFTPRTLRLDLAHRGNARQEQYQVKALVVEGPWAGSRRKLRDPFPYGLHRFEIRDAATSALLYSRGYSSLFGEWRATGEAKDMAEQKPRPQTRTFSESLRIPLPKAPFVLTVFTRGHDGKLARVLRTRLDPGAASVRRLKRRAGLETRALHKSGPPEKRLDVLVIGDGYTAAEQAKFWADAKRFAHALLANPTFGKHRQRINVRALYVPSPVSGVSEPRKGRRLDTPLGLSFNTFDSPRYLMTERNVALRDVAAHAPYDALYLMANTARYGGGGIYNLYSTFPSDNEYDGYVFIHELGHSFGGLGDEYYDSSVSYDDNEFYPKGVEPWEPNITRYLGKKPATIKWRQHLSPGVPIPTPNRARFAGKVGLFEGAGYTAKGMYRPQLDCKMKGKGHTPFCQVCAAAIGRMITLYSEGD